MNRNEIESPAERLLARSPSRLSCDQPDLQRDLKMASIRLMAVLPGFEIDAPVPRSGSNAEMPATATTCRRRLMPGATCNEPRRTGTMFERFRWY